MELLKPTIVDCPYCGEAVEIGIDCSVDAQSYIEDCQVCCRPINISVRVDDSMEPEVRVSTEND